jgi:hypothetical protein
VSRCQGADGVQDIGPEAPRIGERGPLVEHAAIDAPPEVLDEAAEDAPVDPPHRAVHVNPDLSQGQAPFPMQQP